MGIYGVVFDCRSEEEKARDDDAPNAAVDSNLFCCGTWSTLMDDMSLYYAHVCARHRPLRGNVFNYALWRFCADARIVPAPRREECSRVEVLDVAELHTRRGKVDVVRLLAPPEMDNCLEEVLGSSRLTLFSCFGEDAAAVPAVERRATDGRFILTLPFDVHAVERKQCRDPTITYNYGRDRATRTFQVQQEYDAERRWIMQDDDGK